MIWEVAQNTTQGSTTDLMTKCWAPTSGNLLIGSRRLFWLDWIVSLFTIISVPQSQLATNASDNQPQKSKIYHVESLSNLVWGKKSETNVDVVMQAFSTSLSSSIFQLFSFLTSISSEYKGSSSSAGTAKRISCVLIDGLDMQVGESVYAPRTSRDSRLTSGGPEFLLLLMSLRPKRESITTYSVWGETFVNTLLTRKNVCKYPKNYNHSFWGNNIGSQVRAQTSHRHLINASNTNTPQWPFSYTSTSSWKSIDCWKSYKQGPLLQIKLTVVVALSASYLELFQGGLATPTKVKSEVIISSFLAISPMSSHLLLQNVAFVFVLIFIPQIAQLLHKNYTPNHFA